MLASVLWLAGCFRGHRMPPAAPAQPVPAESSPKAPIPFPADFGPRPAYRSALKGGVTESDLDALWQRQLMAPVEGFSRTQIRDDFAARRGERTHAAVDLMAPRFTAVLSADDGVIGRMSNTAIGGIIVYATDLTNRFVYYYAHLQRYQPGLAVGDTVAKGTVIGYVGTTGNAPENIPHLHFQVMKRGTGRAWWDGPPINPYHYFVFDGVRR